MSDCRTVVTLLDAYKDGELPPEQVLEIEAHLADCSSCGARLSFDQAVRKSTRRAVYAAAVPSAAFRERLVAQLKAEGGRSTALPHLEADRRGSMLSWNTIVPLAAAAAFVLLWSSRSHEPKPMASHVQQKTAAAETLNFEQLLDELVERHIDRDVPSVARPELLDNLDTQVGVPVHAPSLAQYGARWEGGGVVPVRKQPAARLRYKLGAHRMTLYVFNPERLALGSERFPLNTRLKKRVVRNEPVYTGWKRGYSIAAKEQRGVGYAVATDLGEDEGAEILASLH